MKKPKGKHKDLPEAESDEAATPTEKDDERARARAEEFSPLIAGILDAEEEE